MHWTFKQYTEDLNKVTEKIESEMVGLQIVATDSWAYPLEKHCVNYILSSQQKMTILEEFILKVVAQDRKKIANNQSIGTLLGLDPIFIETSVKDLIDKEMIDSNFKLTETGLFFFKKSMVPGPSTHEKIEYLFDRIFGHVYANWIEIDKAPISPHIVEIQAAFTRVTKFLNRKFLEKAGQVVGKVVEQPSLGKVVTKIQALDVGDRVHTLMSEIWIYDVLTDQLICRIWDHARQVFNHELGDYFQRHHSNERKKKFELSFDPLNSDYRKSILLLRDLRQKEVNHERYNIIRLYRGSEIKPLLFDCLDKATQQVMIFSPWVSPTVLDRSMLDLFQKMASCNINIALGWGISNQLDQEKPIDPALVKALLSIKNSYGDPKVCLVHVGNGHEKEVVIDNRIHLSGSFNWLSYRGDYKPRGESVYMIQDPEIVQKQKTYWESVFTKSIISNLKRQRDPDEIASQLNFLSRLLDKKDYENVLSDIGM